LGERSPYIWSIYFDYSTYGAPFFAGQTFYFEEQDIGIGVLPLGRFIVYGIPSLFTSAVPPIMTIVIGNISENEFIQIPITNVLPTNFTFNVSDTSRSGNVSQNIVLSPECASSPVFTLITCTYTGSGWTVTTSLLK
jgi:hypothetical protein